MLYYHSNLRVLILEDIQKSQMHTRSVKILNFKAINALFFLS